jgi:hypothetical protein
MARGVRILGTGVRVEACPDPEDALRQVARAFGDHLSPEQRADLAGWRAGAVAFVRLTSFAEFDYGSGVQRWEGTHQGPYAIPTTGSATSTLLALVDSVDEPLLADFGIGDISVSRFEFHAAPRRIEVDPALATRLTLD